MKESNKQKIVLVYMLICILVSLVSIIFFANNLYKLYTDGKYDIRIPATAIDLESIVFDTPEEPCRHGDEYRLVDRVVFEIGENGTQIRHIDISMVDGNGNVSPIIYEWSTITDTVYLYNYGQGGSSDTVSIAKKLNEEYYVDDFPLSGLVIDEKYSQIISGERMFSFGEYLLHICTYTPEQIREGATIMTAERMLIYAVWTFLLILVIDILFLVLQKKWNDKKNIHTILVVINTICVILSLPVLYLSQLF